MQRDAATDLSGTILDERSAFTPRELCRVCGVHPELVIEMVEEGVPEPRGREPSEWRFTGRAVIRAQKALNLARGLRVNWPGAALALDLFDEIERLRAERRAARYRVRRPDSPGD